MDDEESASREESDAIRISALTEPALDRDRFNSASAVWAGPPIPYHYSARIITELTPEALEHLQCVQCVQCVAPDDDDPLPADRHAPDGQHLPCQTARAHKCPYMKTAGLPTPACRLLGGGQKLAA